MPTVPGRRSFALPANRARDADGSIIEFVERLDRPLSRCRWRG